MVKNGLILEQNATGNDFESNSASLLKDIDNFFISYIENGEEILKEV